MFLINPAFVGGVLAFGSKRPIVSVLVLSSDARENKNVRYNLEGSSSLRLPHSRVTCQTWFQYHATDNIGLTTTTVFVLLSLPKTWVEAQQSHALCLVVKLGLHGPSTQFEGVHLLLRSRALLSRCRYLTKARFLVRH